MDKSFFAKILLFGEYTVIFNSKALTIPYSMFSGKLVYPDHSSNMLNANESNKELKGFFKYLKSISDDLIEPINLKMKEVIDLDALGFDLSQGLYFHSSIPQGYGLGSSGALCACVFEQYNLCIGERSTEDLQGIFKILESYFHGSSSGADPLISYLGEPLLFDESGKIQVVNLDDNHNPKGKGAIFLLNTKRARRTEPLVNLFLEKCKSLEFSDVLKRELKPVTNECVQSFLSGAYDKVYELFTKISSQQFIHFDPMIPKLYKEQWEGGLKSGAYALKLCGAGGGGFLLGMTQDFDKAKESLQNQELRTILRF